LVRGWRHPDLAHDRDEGPAEVRDLVEVDAPVPTDLLKAVDFCYRSQNKTCRSRTDETPTCGPNTSIQSARAPGGGGNSVRPSWAHGQVDAIPAEISP
jgi:hypothetical protein